jgi:heptaprenyl diphosphate synthase
METQGSSTDKTALEHYLSVVSDKTASLISASARYGAMISGADEKIMDALTKFGEEIGTVFQLADDIIDIASDSKESGKTPGTDLREGVPTLVTLFILESDDPADAELKKILSAPITDEAIVAQTILTLRSHSALTRSRELVAGYGRSAQKHLEILPEGPAKAALVGLSQAVISRTA